MRDIADGVREINCISASRHHSMGSISERTFQRINIVPTNYRLMYCATKEWIRGEICNDSVL